jgi:hypothetical protein
MKKKYFIGLIVLIAFSLIQTKTFAQESEKNSFQGTL